MILIQKLSLVAFAVHDGEYYNNSDSLLDTQGCMCNLTFTHYCYTWKVTDVVHHTSM